MFKKKKCRKCGEKISGNYNFCPYCRFPLDGSWIEENKRNEDFGLLGKDDEIITEEFMFPKGLNTLINSLFKNISKQLGEINPEREFEREKNRKTNVKRKGGIGISIYSSGDRPPEIKVTSFGNIPKFKEKEKEIKKSTKEYLINLPETDSTRFSGLPKKEPETNIRRLSDKIIYEIKLPNVKSMKDVSIIQLENSIEIKARAKDHVFYKVIPLDFPIKKYNLSKEKLVLELDISE